MSEDMTFEDDTPRRGHRWYQRRSNQVIAGIVVAVLAVLGIMKISYTMHGNRLENSLGATYQGAQNTLSDCLIRSKQSAQTALAQTKAIDTIISDAVKGRYSSANGDGTRAGTVNQQQLPGALISAINEAYPDTTKAAEIYQDVLIVINGCRKNFKTAQDELIDELRAYRDWINGNAMASFFGGSRPSNHLEARNGVNQNDWTHGEQALKDMSTIVLSSDAQDAYKTHTNDPGDLYGTDPAPTPTG